MVKTSNNSGCPDRRIARGEQRKICLDLTVKRTRISYLRRAGLYGTLHRATGTWRHALVGFSRERPEAVLWPVAYPHTRLFHLDVPSSMYVWYLRTSSGIVRIQHGLCICAYMSCHTRYIPRHLSDIDWHVSLRSIKISTLSSFPSFQSVHTITVSTTRGSTRVITLYLFVLSCLIRYLARYQSTTNLLTYPITTSHCLSHLPSLPLLFNI